MKVGCIRAMLHMIVHSRPLRSTLWRQLPHQKTKARTFISPISKSTLPQIVYCMSYILSIDKFAYFGSLSSGANLTLSYGRRYGLIGRNGTSSYLCTRVPFCSWYTGVGKSTLLRHIAMREVPIPPHITILFVEQEVRTHCLIHHQLLNQSRSWVMTRLP
jgi:hypothetical protein